MRNARPTIVKHRTKRVMNAIFGAPSEKLAGPGGVANNARQVARAHSRRIVFDRNRNPAEREKGLQHVAKAAGNAGRDIQNEARFEVITVR